MQNIFENFLYFFFTVYKKGQDRKKTAFRANSLPKLSQCTNNIDLNLSKLPFTTVSSILITGSNQGW